MDGKFALVMICASAIAFAATWNLMDEPAPTSSQAAAVQEDGETLVFKSCEEVRAKGLAPLMAGRPGYNRELDPDGTGMACPPIQ